MADPRQIVTIVGLSYEEYAKKYGEEKAQKALKQIYGTTDLNKIAEEQKKASQELLETHFGTFVQVQNQGQTAVVRVKPELKEEQIGGKTVFQQTGKYQVETIGTNQLPSEVKEAISQVSLQSKQEYNLLPSKVEIQKIDIQKQLEQGIFVQVKLPSGETGTIRYFGKEFHGIGEFEKKIEPYRDVIKDVLSQLGEKGIPTSIEIEETKDYISASLSYSPPFTAVGEVTIQKEVEKTKESFQKDLEKPLDVKLPDVGVVKESEEIKSWTDYIPIYGSAKELYKGIMGTKEVMVRQFQVQGVKIFPSETMPFAPLKENETIVYEPGKMIKKTLLNEVKETVKMDEVERQTKIIFGSVNLALDVAFVYSLAKNIVSALSKPIMIESVSKTYVKGNVFYQTAVGGIKGTEKVIRVDTVGSIVSKEVKNEISKITDISATVYQQVEPAHFGFKRLTTVIDVSPSITFAKEKMKNLVEKSFTLLRSGEEKIVDYSFRELNYLAGKSVSLTDQGVMVSKYISLPSEGKELVKFSSLGVFGKQKLEMKGFNLIFKPASKGISEGVSIASGGLGEVLTKQTQESFLKGISMFMPQAQDSISKTLATGGIGEITKTFSPATKEATTAKITVDLDPVIKVIKRQGEEKFEYKNKEVESILKTSKTYVPIEKTEIKITPTTPTAFTGSKELIKEKPDIPEKFDFKNEIPTKTDIPEKIETPVKITTKEGIDLKIDIPTKTTTTRTTTVPVTYTPKLEFKYQIPFLPPFKFGKEKVGKTYSFKISSKMFSMPKYKPSIFSISFNIKNLKGKYKIEFFRPIKVRI